MSQALGGTQAGMGSAVWRPERGPGQIKLSGAPMAGKVQEPEANAACTLLT